MRLLIDLHEVLHVKVSVALRRADPRVAQQFLDGAEVRTALEKMRGEGVPQWRAG